VDPARAVAFGVGWATFRLAGSLLRQLPFPCLAGGVAAGHGAAGLGGGLPGTRESNIKK
jgi:hypothetical protein